MIDLASPLWGLLTHAYGTATDVPVLLRQLADDPGQKSDAQAEPWHSLWSALCHQGDVYMASYAAVPHLVDIAVKANGPIDFSFFHLPAFIEIARVRGRGPELENPLKAPYLAALSRLHEAAFLHWAEPWNKDMTISVLAALAAAKGQIDVAEAVGNFDDDLIGLINSGRWMEC